MKSDSRRREGERLTKNMAPIAPHLTTHIYGYSGRYFPPNHLLSNRVR